MADDLTRNEDLIILDGSTFFFSEPSGDVQATHADGYFFDDVRHLSVWRLLVDGEPLLGITSSTVDYYSARIFLAPKPADAPFSVRRDRFVTEGVHEDIVVSNLEHRERRLTLELRFDADFADILEAQDANTAAGQGKRVVEEGERCVTLWYERNGFRRGTRIEFSADCAIHRNAVVFDLALEPHGEWRTCADFVAIEGSEEAPPLLHCDSFGAPEREMPLSLEEWFDHAPDLETEDDELERTYLQSLRDLASLRIRPRENLQHAMPAGGIPWFMCVFGRDSILAASEALPFAPTLAEATLQALADLQATEWDDWRDAEPGKIPHELRRGKLVALGENPRDPYYGTHDATQLWLILLDEYERWTGDAGLVRKLEPAAQRALEWIDEYGDTDGDGYLE
jgi:glycogen debranching enzyme